MLFPLNPNTPKCKIFVELNAELLFFLESCINSKRFTNRLFSRYIGQECWNNADTKIKFKGVWDQLPISQAERKKFFDLINNSQNIHFLFSNKSAVIPLIKPLVLFEALKKLTTHLFTRTKKLKEIKLLAKETIAEHYQAYVHSNSELCFLCGTVALSHNRVDLVDDDQWTSDYDHLLCKDKYPAYSCHPDNFIPTCHICNTKAKGAKNALVEKETGKRRKAFYPLPPLTQGFYDKVRVRVVFVELDDFKNGSQLNALVKYKNPTKDEQEMISAWAYLYDVPSRVKARIGTNFCEVVSRDCKSLTFEDFCLKIKLQASSTPLDMKISEWSFWWFRLYEWLNTQGESVKRDAWSLIEWKQQQVNNNNDAEETFNASLRKA